MRVRPRQVATVLAGCALLAAGFAGPTADARTGGGPLTRSPVTGEVRGETTATTLAPLLVSSRFPAIPFRGSEGKVIATYELTLFNATPLVLTPTRLRVTSPSGAVLQTVDSAALPADLALPSRRSGVTELTYGQTATLYVTVEFAGVREVPDHLSNTVTVAAPQLPGGSFTTTPVDVRTVKRLPVPVLGPPLEAGSGYVAADSCCGSERHRRAQLPVDNQPWLVQRFAVDWEQLDARSRTTIADDTLEPASYTIYGKKALAAADGTVVHVVDGLPEQVPGTFPQNIPLSEADGNSVVLDLGHGLYAAYAHMQPGSLAVHVGQRVKRGDLIGLVGNSGNSIAPHLHFQVMDGPSPIAAEGVPYEIDRFRVTGQIPSTALFDEFETTTHPTPVVTTRFDGRHDDEMPLDRYVVTFP
jgi:Peptidase family M23